MPRLDRHFDRPVPFDEPNGLAVKCRVERAAS
jgi:hypothetical protein